MPLFARMQTAGVYAVFYVDSGCANLVASWGGSRVEIPAVRAENGFVARLKQAGGGLRRLDLAPKAA